MRDRGKRQKVLTVLLLFVVLFCLLSEGKAYAASYKIKYNGRTVNFKNQLLDVYYNGEAVDQNGTPGLELITKNINDRYMINVIDIYKKGLGVSCKYSKTTGKVTLKRNGTTLVMTMGSRKAKVNGKKYTMPAPMMKIRYKSVKRTCIMVDSEFVTNALGYRYDWANISPVRGAVYIKDRPSLAYDGKTAEISEVTEKVYYEEDSLDFSDAQTPVWLDGILYLPLLEGFSEGMGADYTENGTITIKHFQNEIVLTEGKNEAVWNGEKITLPSPVYRVKNPQTGYEGIMGPFEFLAGKLGYNYSYDGTSHVAKITRGDVVFAEHKIDSTAAEAVTSIAATGQGGTYLEQVTVKRNGTTGYDRAETTSTITLTFHGTSNVLGEWSEGIKGADYLREISLQKTADGEVLTITRTKNCDYYIKESGSSIEVVLGKKDPESGQTTPDKTEKNGIKIAVDCGHGKDTPGKRTPPLPFDIDIDKDGVVDLKKGEQMQEHQADVGVGKRLADALERCGFTVYRSAHGDYDVPLTTRQANIKAQKCDYSISIHFNAIGDGRTFNSTEGIGIYYYKDPAKAGDSKKMAAAILKYAAGGTPQKNFGVNGQNEYAMCNTYLLGTKASALIECAFMTNKREVTEMMANVDYWEETAEEICQGFCEYTGIPYIAP